MFLLSFSLFSLPSLLSFFLFLLFPFSSTSSADVASFSRARIGERRDLPTINNSGETSGNYYLEWSNAKEEILNGEISASVVALRDATREPRHRASLARENKTDERGNLFGVLSAD